MYTYLITAAFVYHLCVDLSENYLLGWGGGGQPSQGAADPTTGYSRWGAQNSYREAPKTPTGGPQKSYRGTSKLLQGDPKILQGGPKNPSRKPQKSFKKTPKIIQGAPKNPAGGPPKSSRGTPKILQGDDKSPTWGPPNILQKDDKNPTWGPQKCTGGPQKPRIQMDPKIIQVGGP